jgi:hypothetical protein
MEDAVRKMAEVLVACHEAGGKAYGVWTSLVKTAGRAAAWEALRGVIEDAGTAKDEALSEAHRIVAEALTRGGRE